VLNSRWLAPWAMTLWGLVFFALLGLLLPWQAGKVAERAMPAVLDGLGQVLQGEARLTGMQRAWGHGSAQVELHLPSLREAIPLALDIQHGPWLGAVGLGWLGMRAPWPGQGGVTPFPPQERLELRLKVGLLGDVRMDVWRLSSGGDEVIGRFRMQRGSRTLVGEARLPGLLIKHVQGDARLAEMNVRARLVGGHGRAEGAVGLDAVRAGLGRGAEAWLIDQPRLDLSMEPGAEGWRRMSLQWQGVRGGADLGGLDMALRWQAVDGSALRASLDRRALRLNDPRRLRRQLDRLGMALGQGEIVLERFELAQPAGRMRLEGLMRGREASSGLRRLHVDLRLGADRAVAIKAIRDSRWVGDEAGAERLLETLKEQHILDGADWLQGAASLWDGGLTLSGRPMALDEVLGTGSPLNSDGID